MAACRNNSNALSSCVADRFELGKNQHLSLVGLTDQTIFQITSGLTMTVRFADGDRRQVLGFQRPNGLVVADPKHQDKFIEFVALEPSNLLRFDRKALSEAVGEDATIANALFSDTLCSLVSQQTAYQRLLCHSAEARVAAFLIDYGGLAHSQGAAEQVLALPMRRIDIADHLGLRTETLCRILADWRRRGLIDANGPRQIVIKRPYELWLISEERSAQGRHPKRRVKKPKSVKRLSGVA